MCGMLCLPNQPMLWTAGNSESIMETKERDELAIAFGNIALIEGGHPIVGAICVPALDQVYVAGATAFRADLAAGGTLGAMKVIATSPVPAAGLRAIASRSHMNTATEEWLRQRPVADLQRAGSSLKFCLIARGDADVYPRIGTIMEWDTAAGHG